MKIIHVSHESWSKKMPHGFGHLPWNWMQQVTTKSCPSTHVHESQKCGEHQLHSHSHILTCGQKPRGMMTLAILCSFLLLSDIPFPVWIIVYPFIGRTRGCFLFTAARLIKLPASPFVVIRNTSVSLEYMIEVWNCYARSAFLEI